MINHAVKLYLPLGPSLSFDRVFSEFKYVIVP